MLLCISMCSLKWSCYLAEVKFSKTSAKIDKMILSDKSVVIWADQADVKTKKERPNKESELRLSPNINLNGSSSVHWDITDRKILNSLS